MIENIIEIISNLKDPELHQSFGTLKMLSNCEFQNSYLVVDMKLTIAGCPMRDEIENLIKSAVAKFISPELVKVQFTAMSDAEREEVKSILRKGKEKTISFALPDNTTRVIGIASGKGGVGKSSLTATLAVALTKKGFKVGVLDADIYGHSIPRLLNLIGKVPTNIDQTFIPLESFGVKVVSIEMFKQSRLDPVAYRGPLLHRVLEQLLADAYWGDLDFLLLDLPPGTGDIAISLGQLIPNSEILVVTNPAIASSEVSERAGRLAHQMKQKIIGVVENLSFLTCERCGEKQYIFGSGGGEATAKVLSEVAGYEVPLLAKIPFDPLLRVGGDEGRPLLSDNSSSTTSYEAIIELAEKLTFRLDSLVGRTLPLA
jgi:ATP-binding protein involved in chromosome partitioning